MVRSKSGFFPAVRSVILSILCLSLFLSFVPGVSRAAQSPPSINAESYILADLKSGKILLSKDPDTPRVPASLTKIMTLYLLFDDISAGKVHMDDMVPVSEAAWATEGSKMYILVGTQVKLSDLIKGITVMSGNDACVAVAEYLSGNVTSFVDRMNRKAKELGLSSAYFVDPHGLSDLNRISARDLLTLVRSYVNTHPEALQFHSLKEFTYTAPGEPPKDPQFNRNRLLWTYPGVYGLKTGYTSIAGFNMVALCERSGLDLVAIVLGCAKGKSIEEGEAERAATVSSMLDWAYRNFSYVKVADPGSSMGKVRVWYGRGKWVEAVAPYGVGATVEKGQEDKLRHTVALRKDVTAPLSRGTKVGEVVFTVDGNEVGRVDLVAKTDTPRGNIFRVVWDGLARAFLRAFGQLK